MGEWFELLVCGLLLFTHTHTHTHARTHARTRTRTYTHTHTHKHTHATFCHRNSLTTLLHAWYQTLGYLLSHKIQSIFTEGIIQNVLCCVVLCCVVFGCVGWRGAGSVIVCMHACMYHSLKLGTKGWHESQKWNLHKSFINNWNVISNNSKIHVHTVCMLCLCQNLTTKFHKRTISLKKNIYLFLFFSLWYLAQIEHYVNITCLTFETDTSL